MRVLVACEFSGEIREAFTALGHDAWSCDLLKSERPSDKHLQADVLELLGAGWDLMVAHPPCTYLAASGLHWNARSPNGERGQRTERALAFVQELLEAPIPRIALENPIGCISTRLRKPDQIVQPWWFGADESKATCLWLKDLPPLEPAIDGGLQREIYNNQLPNRQNKWGEARNRWKERSRTSPGFARAMAEQWSAYSRIF